MAERRIPDRFPGPAGARSAVAGRGLALNGKRARHQRENAERDNEEEARARHWHRERVAFRRNVISMPSRPSQFKRGGGVRTQFRNLTPDT
jgi:hypothetical protein